MTKQCARRGSRGWRCEKDAASNSQFCEHHAELERACRKKLKERRNADPVLLARHRAQVAAAARRRREKLEARLADNAQCRAWYERNKEYNKKRARNIKLRLAYGIGTAEFEQMLAAQNGRCACCGTSRPGGKGNTFHVDHDHVTGKVRGLLCANCNVMLGNAGDDSARLAAGIAYLNRHKGAVAA